MFRKLLIIFLSLSIIINILLGSWLISAKVNEDKMSQQIKAQQTNGKVLSFGKLFVEKVLQGQGEISFDDRLLLENAVRDLNDKAIFDQWQNFTKSKSNEEAQQAAASLFTVLLDKISY